MATLPQYLIDRGFSETQANNAVENREALLRAWRGQAISSNQCLQIWQKLIDRGSLNNCGGIEGLASLIGAPIDKTQEAYDHIVSFIDARLVELE